MEEGISHLFLVAKSATYLKSKIDHYLPKKKTHALAHDKYSKAQTAFFTKIIMSMLKNINFEVVKSIIIASPGFTKDEFFGFLKSELKQNKYPELKNRLDLFMLEHVTSGFKHSLKELLTNKTIQDKILTSSAISEAKILEDFKETLRKNPDQAAYGKSWIEAAVEQKAVKVLLISDKVLKAKNNPERSKYIAMTKSVKENGGSVIFFSSMHATGEGTLFTFIYRA
jgi:protein pelota